MRRRFPHLLAVSVLALAAACSSPEQKLERYSQNAAELLAEGDLAKAYIQYQNAIKINEEHVPSLLGLAEIAEQRQDFQAMFGFLQRIVRLDPTQVEAQVKIGKLYLIGSDETTALEQAEKALAIEPENLNAKALKAGVLMKIGDNAGAVELARDILAKDPANAEAVTVLATDYSVNGDYDAALAELDKALAIDPQMAMLQLLRIHLLKKVGRTEEARAGYATLIDLFPEQSAYRRVYASELIRDKDYEGAREQLEAIVSIEPDNFDAKLDVIRAVKVASGSAAAEAKLQSYISDDPGNSKLKLWLSDFYVSEGDKEKAKDVLNELASGKDQDVALQAKNKITTLMLGDGDREGATALINEILEADERNTDALIKRAAIQIEAEQYDQAIVNLRTALDNSPDSYDAMLLMSAAFEKQDNFSFAQAELAKAYEGSKRDAKVANHFARFLLRRKNTSRAEEVLVSSLASHPGNIENLRLLASIRLVTQNWRGAEEVGVLLEQAGDKSALASNIKSAAYVGLEDFDSVIETLSARSETAPLDTRPLAALVNAYIREERTDEAEALLLRMLETDPENYAAKLSLARVYSVKSDFPKFEAALNSATETNPDRAEAYELLYRSYLGAGRRADAAALIERGLRAAPDNDALRVFKADVLLQEGDREGALALYTDLLETRPNDQIIANNFVSLSSDLRSDPASIAKALEVSKKIEGLDNPFYRDTVGWAHYRAGDYATAIDFLTKALTDAEGNAEMLYHLGAAQLASGDVEAGRANLEKALSAGGANFPFVNEVRALLDRQ